MESSEHLVDKLSKEIKINISIKPTIDELTIDEEFIKIDGMKIKLKNGNETIVFSVDRHRLINMLINSGCLKYEHTEGQE